MWLLNTFPAFDLNKFLNLDINWIWTELMNDRIIKPSLSLWHAKLMHYSIMIIVLITFSRIRRSHLDRLFVGWSNRVRVLSKKYLLYINRTYVFIKTPPLHSENKISSIENSIFLRKNTKISFSLFLLLNQYFCTFFLFIYCYHLLSNSSWNCRNENEIS